MTVKPLNLSILIGDMNNSPPGTPRSLQNNNNKKSRIPLATSQNVPGSGHISRGATTFRQWADPPPPPARSRTLERKLSKEKKRTGSADPRFRRSLECTKSNIHQQNDSTVVVPEMKKQSNSFCDLITVDDTKEKPNEYPHGPVFDNKEDNIEYLKKSNPLNLEGNIDIKEIKVQPHLKEEIPIHVKHVRHKEYDFHNIDSFGTINREELKLNEVQSLGTTRTESKYSQTDMYSNEFSNDAHETRSPEPVATNDTDNDVIQYISTNYEQQSRYLDGIVLNRTRSISTIYELEPVIKTKNVNKRNYGSISRIFLNHSYSAYLEIWAALAFVIILLLFGWYYLLPYLTEVFFTWIYPAPPMTASDYIRKSVTEVVTSTAETVYSLLTTPANRRLA